MRAQREGFHGEDGGGDGADGDMDVAAGAYDPADVAIALAMSGTCPSYLAELGH